MRILVLANTVLVRGGISGGDIVLPFMSKYWNSKFTIKIITTTQGKAVWDSIGSRGEFVLLPHFKYEDRELKFTFFFTYIMRTIFAIPLLKKVLKDNNGKKIILSASDFFPDVLPAYFAKKNKDTHWLARVYHLIKSPSERKGNFVLNILSFLLQKISLRLIQARADMILTPTGTYKELYGLGFKKEKIAISNPGVDLEEMDSVTPSDKQSDAIFIGALLFNKGSYDLVKIWSEVVKKINNARLTVIGGGPKKEVDYFRKSIEDAHLSLHIEYLGYVKDIREVYARLKSSKILILTGQENGWSIPVTEAFACGVPVVAYNLKMFGTAFNRGFITVALYDIDGFAKEIINILNDPQRREGLAREAFAEGRLLGWERVAQNLAKQIDSIRISK